jgi:hypothetical protein
MNAPVRLDKSLPENKIAHSFTKREKFDKCPRAYYEEYIAKTKCMQFKETVHTGLGTAVHDYLQQMVLLGSADVNEDELHRLCYEQMQDYNTDLIDGVALALEWTQQQTGLRIVEQDWSLTIKMKPTDWFGKKGQVFDRAKADFVCINEPHALIVDYKTGSDRYTNPDQLVDMAIHVMARFPEVHEVDARILHVRELDPDSDSGVSEKAETIKREDVRDRRLVHWFEHHKEILERNESGDWPMNPSDQNCRFCAYKDCDHHPTGI